MNNYIKDKADRLIKSNVGPDEDLLEIINFLSEFDYATKYLSRQLKVRGFVIYILLFKKAFFSEGKRNITIKLSELGENLLSDLGLPMSHDVVKRGVNDLIKLKIIEKAKESKPGQVNEYIIRLPSELREVQMMMAKENDAFINIIETDKDDFYVDKNKRIELLIRDDYQCFYCRCTLQNDNFILTICIHNLMVVIIGNQI